MEIEKGRRMKERALSFIGFLTILIMLTGYSVSL